MFGHAGARLLIFPTSMGRFFEWEDRGMIATLGDYFDNGWLQAFCVDSVDGESWYNKRAHPAQRARRHTQYDQYLATEAVAFSLSRNPNPFLITTGASFGAYHALSFALRHPEAVGRVLGMHGLYDVRSFTDGYSDEDVYYANPFEFIVHEGDPGRLDAVRRMDIILVTGREDVSYENNEELSRRLWRKGIWHALRVWNGWYHDWPHWHQMIRMYIGGHD